MDTVKLHPVKCKCLSLLKGTYTVKLYSVEFIQLVRFKTEEAKVKVKLHLLKCVPLSYTQLIYTVKLHSLEFTQWSYILLNETQLSYI